MLTIVGVDSDVVCAAMGVLERLLQWQVQENLWSQWRKNAVGPACPPALAPHTIPRQAGGATSVVERLWGSCLRGGTCLRAARNTMRKSQMPCA